MHGKGIQIGQVSECHRIFTQQDVCAFADLIGDWNPVHFQSTNHEGIAGNVTEAFLWNNGEPTSKQISEQKFEHSSEQVSYSEHHARERAEINTTKHRTVKHKPIVHGMFASSMFSTIFGTLNPGAIYRSQTLKFQSMLYVDEEVVGRILVKKVRQIDRRVGPCGGNKGGVLCTCDTSVVKVLKQVHPNENFSNYEEIDNGLKNEKEEIVCISGEAQVWLPGAIISWIDET